MVLTAGPGGHGLPSAAIHDARLPVCGGDRLAWDLDARRLARSCWPATCRRRGVAVLRPDASTSSSATSTGASAATSSSVPTDCPQRDERLGWMGDAQVFVRTGCCNADVAAFFTKWLVDVDDRRRRTAPTATSSRPADGAGGRQRPAWGDAGVICPGPSIAATATGGCSSAPSGDAEAGSSTCHRHNTEPDLGHADRQQTTATGWRSARTRPSCRSSPPPTSPTRADLVARKRRGRRRQRERRKYRAALRAASAARSTSAATCGADGRIIGDTQCGVRAWRSSSTCCRDALRPSAAQYLDDDIRREGRRTCPPASSASATCSAGPHPRTVKPDTAYTLLCRTRFPPGSSPSSRARPRSGSAGTAGRRRRASRTPA